MDERPHRGRLSQSSQLPKPASLHCQTIANSPADHKSMSKPSGNQLILATSGKSSSKCINVCTKKYTFVVECHYINCGHKEFKKLYMPVRIWPLKVFSVNSMLTCRNISALFTFFPVNLFLLESVLK